MTRVSLLGSAPALASYLGRCGLSVADDLVPDADLVLVAGPQGLSDELEDRLLALTVPLLLVGPTASTAVTDAAGLVPGRLTPEHEVRVRPGPDAGQVMDRSGGDLLVRDRWPLQEKVADDVQVLLTTNVAFTDHAVATWRPGTGVGMLTVGSTASTLADPLWQRVVHRLVRHLLGQRDGAPVRVGVLGYGAIGHEHNAAIQLTQGLELAAVCDTDPRRIEAARTLAPGLRAHSDGRALLEDDGVDLVIVSTP
ncbi:MAG: Gfo/Idh/MocA family oxidoreductase, partial [Mycobacteriales bacterium]